MPLWRVKNGKWRMRFYQDGTRTGPRVMKTLPAHLTHAEANRLYLIELAKAAGRRGRAVPRDLTVAEAVTQYVTAREGTWAPNTFKNVKNILEVNVVRLLGEKRVDALRPSDFVDYQKTRTGEGTAPATVNREVALMRTMFRHLVKWGWTEKTPIPPDSVTPLRAPKARIDFFSVDDWKRLVAVLEAPPPAPKGKHRPRMDWRPMLPVVKALLYTGARLNEVLGLRWADVDLDEGRLTIRRYKTDSVTGLRISAPLREVLEALPRGTPAGYVFTSPSGEPWPPHHIQFAISDARKLAGLRRTLSTHSLRHSFISWLVMDGVDLRTVAELAGHRDIAQTARYAHLTPQHLQTAIDRIGLIEGRWKPSAGTSAPPDAAPIPIDSGRRR